MAQKGPDTKDASRSTHHSNHTLQAAGAVVLLALFCAALPAVAQTRPKVEAPKFNPAELTETLNTLMETQRTLVASMVQLHDQLGETQGVVNELREELHQHQEASQAALEQIKGMREEVRGLYVESSGLKGDITQLGKQLEGLDQSLGSFRLSSGVVVALVIVLQVGIVGLMFRGRG